MRERCRVEVELKVILLGPLHPTLEILYAYLVTVYELAIELTIDFMEIQAERTSQERLHFLYVLTQFVYVASLAWIVACRLDATRSSLATLKTYYIVCLPAVQ